MERSSVVWGALLAATAFLLAGPFLGTHEFQVVLSSSMEPTMSAGGLAVVAHTPPDQVQKGDILAFRRGGEGPMISHRVVAVNETPNGTRFQTKGDALEQPDEYRVRPADVTGTVVFTVPALGYAVNGLRTGNPAMMVAFVVVPAVMLIYGEVRGILRELEVLEDPPEARRALHPRRLAVVAGLAFLAGAAVTAPFAADVGPLPAPQAGGHPVPGVYGADVPGTGYVMAEVVPAGEQPALRGRARGTLVAAPHVLPVFWLVNLAEVHPYLAPASTALLPAAAATALAAPLWYPRRAASPEEERGDPAAEGAATLQVVDRRSAGDEPGPAGDPAEPDRSASASRGGVGKEREGKEDPADGAAGAPG